MVYVTFINKRSIYRLNDKEISLLVVIYCMLYTEQLLNILKCYPIASHLRYYTVACMTEEI